MSLMFFFYLMVCNLLFGQWWLKIVQVIGEESVGCLQWVLLECVLCLFDCGFSVCIFWFDDDLDSDLQVLVVVLGWSLMSQLVGDFGECMWCIVVLGLVESEVVLLICYDCLVLDGDYLEVVCIVLGCYQVVLGLVEWGGYVLFGLIWVDLLLFELMFWGGDCLLVFICECFW